MLGLFLGLAERVLGGGAETVYYFVRPAAGGPYGNADGTTYADAWAGFSNVNQSTVANAGGELAICGEHFEALVVSVNNLHIIGNHPAGAGIINGQNSRATGINIDGKTGFEATNLTLKNHTTQHVLADKTFGITMTDCVTDTCGNQAFQHLWTSGFAGGTANYYNITSTNNSDEVFSIHGNTVDLTDVPTVNIYGGEFGNNTSAFVNFVSGAIVNIYGVCNTYSNGVDLEVGSTTSSPRSVCNVYDSRLTNFTVTAFGELNFYNTHVTRAPQLSGGGSGTLTDNISGILRMYRCRIDGTGTGGTAQGVLDFQSGSTVVLSYVDFINMPSGIYAFMVRSGTTVTKINNVDVVGNANVGNGVFRVMNFSIYNSIFRNLLTVDNNAGITYENCSFSSNTNAVNGTQNQSINNDPLFWDEANKDFSLQPESTMFGGGETVTGYETGIGSVDWGSVGVVPDVTEETQPASWTIGSVISVGG